MLKEIYITHVDGYCGALGCVAGCNRHFYSFCPQGEFIDWVQSLQTDFPDFRLRCVENDGIKEWLRQRLAAEKILKMKGKDNARY